MLAGGHTYVTGWPPIAGMSSLLFVYGLVDPVITSLPQSSQIHNLYIRHI